MRSRQARYAHNHPTGGITSACAEQTACGARSIFAATDHLRVCGADTAWNIAQECAAGSPPRVRSRPAWRVPARLAGGITSACAEQTPTMSRVTVLVWDHLRVCGADAWLIPRSVPNTGSPPRVRSRRFNVGIHIIDHGITSACAEQTITHSQCPAAGRDHLRVCGADCEVAAALVAIWGSPPRVRSRLILHVQRPVAFGITSACAEQTARGAGYWRGNGDHLRVCGADEFPTRHYAR